MHLCERLQRGWVSDALDEWGSNELTAGGHAYLTGMVKGAEAAGPYRQLDVGILEHDQR